MTSMQVFIAIARRGSFGGGAEEVGVSRAMASKHIKALETELGVRLLNRTTRSISLTEAGEIYLEQIGPLLEQLDTVEARVTRQSTEPKGNLTIAAPTSFGMFHLAPVIAAYMEQYPQVKVHFTLTDREVNLVDEGFDVAIVIRELEDSSYVARRLGAARMIICAAPAYLQEHGEPKQPSDLRQHNCLIFSESATHAKADWPFDVDGNVASITTSGDLVANLGGALRIAAIAGRGIARLPDYMIESELADNRLVAVLTSFEQPPKPIWIVYPHRELLASKVRTFVDFAADALRPR